MFYTISEKTMHAVRWILSGCWLLLIASLFYDPVSPLLTDPSQLESPFRARPEPEACVFVQGTCLPQDTYGLGAPIFWGIVIPGAVLVLLLFGHELWRRICPLSFLSQIPRALGIQRKHERVSPSGSVRFELARVKPDSWLGRNYQYLQFGWFFIGLCVRILFINADRLALAAWLIFTIAAAIVVGYLYSGKSWCNYFCPMAPVQSIYSEPGGLLTSAAHLSDTRVTQSMCREVDDSGQEKSACVACKSPCIDIDSERTYWDALDRPQRRLLYYGYASLVVGYFCYYYLYSGNWNYYLSGVWAYETGTRAKLFAPGFYIAGHAISFVPKIVAVPLTLGLFTAVGYWLGRRWERWGRAWFPHQSPDMLLHWSYTLITFFIFNFFFIFAGRNFIVLLPVGLQYFWEVVLVALSTAWLYRTWNRSPARYRREGLAGRLRKQLGKLKLDFASLLDGRSSTDLSPDEVYVLAKVLPGFDREKRVAAYKGVLKESLEEGYVDIASSFERLAQMRAELSVSEEEHQQVLAELGMEDPELLDPSRTRTLEGSFRLSGYRDALERLLTLQKQQSVDDLLQENPEAVRNLRQEYSISYQEEEEILQGLDRQADLWLRAQHLLGQLDESIGCYDALNQPVLHEQRHVLTLLLRALLQKQRLLVRGLLEIMETATEPEDAQRVAGGLSGMAPVVLPEVLENPASQWARRLEPALLTLLRSPSADRTSTCAIDLGNVAIATQLRALLLDPNPTVRVASLFILQQVTPHAARMRIRELQQSQQELPAIEREAIEVLAADPAASLSACPLLEKLVLMVDTPLFQDVHGDTLLELAAEATFRIYQADDVIIQEGDVRRRELLVLTMGKVETHTPCEDGQMTMASLLPGQLLDQLEILSPGDRAGKIMAAASPTRVLAIPVDAFDELLHRDRAFARRVLEWESKRLQQLARAR